MDETCVVCLETIKEGEQDLAFTCPREVDPCTTRCHQSCLQRLDAQPPSRCPTCRTLRNNESDENHENDDEVIEVRSVVLSPSYQSIARSSSPSPPPSFSKKLAMFMLVILIAIWVMLASGQSGQRLYPSNTYFDKEDLSFTMVRDHKHLDTWDRAIADIVAHDGSVSIEFYKKLNGGQHFHPQGWGHANASSSALTVHLEECEYSLMRRCTELKVSSVQAYQDPSTSSFPALVVILPAMACLVTYILRSE